MEAPAVSGNFAREINLLSDSDRSARKRAIANLGLELSILTSAHLISLLIDPSKGGLLKALVKCFWDPVESIREECAELCERLLAMCGVFDEAGSCYILPLLIPALRSRIGSRQTVEESEEVRLALAKVNRALIFAVQPCDLTPFMDDVCVILISCLADDYHEVKKETCTSVCLVSGKIRALEDSFVREEIALDRSEQMVGLVNAILPNIEHTHAKVRMACIDAIGACLSTYVDMVALATIVSRLRTLSRDKQPTVRERYFHCMSSVLLARGKEDTSVISLLLPHLLQGIGDDVARVADRAAFLVENTATFILGDRQIYSGKISPPTISHDFSMQTIYGIDVAEVTGFAENLRASHPKSCALICENLENLLNVALSEVGEWTKTLRGAATSLLGILIAYGSQNMKMFLPNFFNQLCNAFMEEDEYVTRRLIVCCILLGSAVPPDDWIPLAISQIFSVAGAAQAGALVALCMLLYGTSNTSKDGGGNATMTASHYEKIAACLASDEVRCSEHHAVRAQLLQLAHRIVSCVQASGLDMTKDLNEKFSLNIFLVLLQLKALPDQSMLNAQATLEINTLALALDLDSHSTFSSSAVDGQLLISGSPLSVVETKLHARFLSPVLDNILADRNSALWADGSKEILLLDALLRNAGPAILLASRDEVCSLVALFCSMTDSTSREAGFRSFFLELLESIFLSTPQLDRELTVWHGEPVATLLIEVFAKNAVWGVGRVAAACRFANVRALKALFNIRGLCGCIELSPILSKLLPSLVSCSEEDYYADTRLESVRCLEAILRIMGKELGGIETDDPFEERRRQIYPALLARLDDSDDRVRLAATNGLLAFLEGAGGYDVTNLGYLIKGILVHMDDANSTIQRAVCDVIKSACIVCKDIVMEHLPEARATHRTQDYIAEVESFLTESP